MNKKDTGTAVGGLTMIFTLDLSRLRVFGMGCLGSQTVFQATRTR